MKYELELTHQYLKDLKLARKRGLDENKLNEIILKLIMGEDYRNNGILSYIQVGGKILYRTSDVQRTIMSGFKEAYRLKDT